MDQRKENLLKLIIENYIDSAEPVGSKFLVEEAALDVSGATVRNEMRELEEAGYLTHPHTSAGRIPTESGYRYYVERLMGTTPAKKLDVKKLETLAKADGLKSVGKYVADATESAVIIALNRNSVYYTGISYLFAQPEFQDYAHTVRMSEIFDHCEDHIDELYEAVEKTATRVLIGQENPLGGACTLFATRLPQGKLFAVMAPLRTAYVRTLQLVEAVKAIA